MTVSTRVGTREEVPEEAQGQIFILGIPTDFQSALESSTNGTPNRSPVEFTRRGDYP